MALDRVNHRMFVPEPGNIRVLVYQLDEKGQHVRHTADHVIGHRSLVGRRRQSVTNRTDGAGGAETGLAVDNIYQRLFVRDRNRILVFNIHPDDMQDYPEATHVIGQPDFETMTSGAGQRQFSGSEIIVDEDTQRLFVEDGSRILVFDIDPTRLVDFPNAKIVIGQPDFKSREQGLGPNRLTRAHGIALDPDEHRLFVSDQNNNRILVFDIHPDRLANDPHAVAVLGQPDFYTNTPRFSGARARPANRFGVRSITPGGLDYDRLHKRLFVSQLPDNRILVFEAAPDKLQDNLEAFVVVGQPDFTTFDPVVSQTRFAFPKDPSVDSEKQMLYVSEGFPGGNRVMAFDIRPEVLRSGLAALDVIGHVDDAGRDDFNRRMANDRLDARTTTMARAVALDAVDHRLWVADEYNNRVLGFRLDRHNRLLEYEARWVFGQPDFQTAKAARSATGINVPLALAYDVLDKRLYVGDGWNDRVLIYETNPETLSSGGGHVAVAVLGQPDFETQEPQTSRNRFDFAVDIGRGIASNMLPVGIAIDFKNRRAFVADGGNHRVLVFDIDRDRLTSGSDAINVLGQPDFTSGDPGLAAHSLSSPGHLAYDADNDRLFVVDNRNHRLLVFAVAPDVIQDGMAAISVLGQPDFSSTTPATQLRGPGKVITGKSFTSPNGVAYDHVKQRLYVADQGADRVLVFDVTADRMKNHPTALAVLGQRDEMSQSGQVLRDVSAQDQLYDPRGLAFDSINQQLYVMDSHWARMLIFRDPSSRHRIEVPPNGVARFSSLDPILALTEPELILGQGKLQVDAGVAGLWMKTRTKVLMDTQTEQQSRLLLNQVAGRLEAPTMHALVLADGRDGAKTVINVTNETESSQAVGFTLRSGNAISSTVETLTLGASMTVDVAELLDGSFDTGALEVTSDAPVSVAAWHVLENKYGEEIISMAPVVRGLSPNSVTVLPHVMIGGGYETDIVLLNVENESVQGEIALIDDEGQEIEYQRYEVSPQEAFIWQPSTGSLLPRRTYAVVHPTSSFTPLISALVSRSDVGLITRVGLEPVANVMYARIPIQSMPDLIRHGQMTRLDLVIANPAEHAASVRFVLRDLDGQEVDRDERLILQGVQNAFTLGSLFNRVQFAGSLSIASDVPIAWSARQVTTNLRGDEILTEIPVLTDSSASGKLVFPYNDGQGNSTQLFMIAGATGRLESHVEFVDMGGQLIDVIAR